MSPLIPNTAHPRAFLYSVARGVLTLGALLLMVLISTPAYAQEDATTMTTLDGEGSLQEGTAVLETTTISPETTPPASMTTVPAYEDTTSVPAVEDQYASPSTLADTGGTGPLGFLVVIVALVLGAAFLTFAAIRSRTTTEEQPVTGGDDDFMPRS